MILWQQIYLGRLLYATFDKYSWEKQDPDQVSIIDYRYHNIVMDYWITNYYSLKYEFIFKNTILITITKHLIL